MMVTFFFFFVFSGTVIAMPVHQSTIRLAILICLLTGISIHLPLARLIRNALLPERIPGHCAETSSHTRICHSIQRLRSQSNIAQIQWQYIASSFRSDPAPGHQLYSVGACKCPPHFATTPGARASKPEPEHKSFDLLGAHETDAI